jgi:hypothetical protein
LCFSVALIHLKKELIIVNVLFFSSDEVGSATAEHAKKRDGDRDIFEPRRKKKKLKLNKKKKVGIYICIYNL